MKRIVANHIRDQFYRAIHFTEAEKSRLNTVTKYANKRSLEQQ